MKVALLVPGGVDRSGTERVIPCLLALIERIARVHELHVFAMRQEPRPCEYDLLGARVHNIGGYARFVRRRALGALLRENARAPFEVLHAVWVSQGAVAAAAARRLGLPVLLHLTGGDLANIPDIAYGRLRNRRGRALFRRAVAGADRLTTPSEWMRSKAARLGIDASRLTYGVDLARWPPRPPEPRPDGRPPRLLHVASLNRVKDQPTLLRMAARLAHAGTAFHLDMIGVDTLDGEIQRLAGRLGLDRHVRFHGYLPQAQLRPWVERADLLLMSSRHEGDPIVALEAAVAGVPTVGTAVGHLADWTPEAALAVPVGDDAALATAVRALLADEDRRVRLAAAAQARALDADADGTARQVLEIYGQLAGPRT